MEFEMSVRSVSSHMTTAKVMYEGAEISAEVATLEVHLEAPEDATHGAGSMQLAFKGPRIEEARKMFVVDQTVVLTAKGTGNWIPGKGPAGGKPKDAA